jgi:flavin reductase (DIM6/NTAB) family NADH-FMN oxidoreductase RutF
MALSTFPASKINGVLVKGCYLFLECSLHSVLDDFDGYSLIIGHIVAAAAHNDALRRLEIDESDQIYQFPLLAYLHPNRLAEIRQSTAFPLPEGFSR